MNYLDSHEHVVFLLELQLARCSDGLGKRGCPTFSSPIVNLPCVSSLLSANAWSFLMASLCCTEMANLTLDLVYSCPG